MAYLWFFFLLCFVRLHGLFIFSSSTYLAQIQRNSPKPKKQTEIGPVPRPGADGFFFWKKFLLRKSVFPPWALKPDKPSTWTFKIIRFTSITGYKRFSKTVLSFSFLFISAESLKKWKNRSLSLGDHSSAPREHKLMLEPEKSASTSTTKRKSLTFGPDKSNAPWFASNTGQIHKA